jgi:ribonuclease HII
MPRPATATALVAGVDEAGRGPLAGPVFAAAVILDPERVIAGLADSKRLSERARLRLCADIRERALAWAVARVDNPEIDRINILNASLLAMTRAVESLKVAPQLVLVDGQRCPRVSCAVRAIVRGDATVPAISAASILAKVARDEEMMRMDSVYPGYGFARHKGYPTAEHLRALARLGACSIHRRSFAPVLRCLCGEPPGSLRHRQSR